MQKEQKEMDTEEDEMNANWLIKKEGKQKGSNRC